ncbi:hypothetical protein EDB85DRAFT_1944215, partial [Lactarius pseudohatsudake]
MRHWLSSSFWAITLYSVLRFTFFPRASVVLITPDPTATGISSTPHTSLSVVTKGVIGGVAALLAIGAIALVVWRRRRRGYRRTSA